MGVMLLAGSLRRQGVARLILILIPVTVPALVAVAGRRFPGNG